MKYALLVLTDILDTAQIEFRDYRHSRAFGAKERRRELKAEIADLESAIALLRREQEKEANLTTEERK